MKNIIFLCSTIFACTVLKAQNTFQVVVKNNQTTAPIKDANILFKNKITKATDSNGYAVFNNIPDGKQEVVFSYTGLKSKTETYTFPLATNDTVIIYLAVNYTNRNYFKNNTIRSYYDLNQTYHQIKLSIISKICFLDLIALVDISSSKALQIINLLDLYDAIK